MLVLNSWSNFSLDVLIKFVLIKKRVIDKKGRVSVKGLARFLKNKPLAL